MLLRIAGEILSNALARKHAHDALKESEGRFRAIFDSSALGIALSAMDGHIVQTNRSLSELTGYSEEEFRGRTFADITHPDDLNLNVDLFGDLVAGKIAHYSMEKRYIKRDGSPVWVNLIVSLLRDARGNPQYALGMVQDINERKRAQEEIRKQIERLAALRSIDNAINSTFDLPVVLDTILQQVTTQLRVDAACVLLLNPHSGELEYAAGIGFFSDSAPSERDLKSGLAAMAVQTMRLVEVPDATMQSPWKRNIAVEGDGFRAYYAAPLVVKGKVVGVLELFHRQPLSAHAGWVDFLETLAGQTAIAVDNSTLFRDLQRYNLELALAYETTLEGWSHALDLRDHETEGHTRRVTDMTVRLARSMGIDEATLVHIRRGALLHDIGKMGIPDSVLLKPGALTEEEWAVMRLHPVYAYELLSPIAYLRPSLDIPYCHHEKWDGTGYPRGLKGEEIPFAARIFAIIDVYDALRSDRPYRAAWSEERTVAHISSLAGTHFDPIVVDAFLRMDRSPFARTPTTPELVLDHAGRQ